MKLVVIGGGTLEDWVCKFFSLVENVDVNPVQIIQSSIWKAKTIYWLEGVKDGHQLTLSWVLPPLQGDYLKKADKYIDYLLGHEGKGSLFYLLKFRRWATSIHVGVDNEGIVRTSFSHIFAMTLDLTDSGVEKTSEIIGFVYQFIKLLRENDPSHEVFMELQECMMVDFRYILHRCLEFFRKASFYLRDIKKELESIDEEFRGYLEHDGGRLEQLQCHTSADGHPFNKFTWRNQKSLFGATRKEAELKKHVQKLYKEHHHASNMELVVIGEVLLRTGFASSLVLSRTWM